MSEVDLGTESIPAILQYLMDNFKAVLKNRTSSLKDVSLAIQGYGEFSKPLHKFLSEEQYLNLCLEVLAQTEQFHIESSPEEQEKSKLHFPSHIRSVAMLISELTAPSVNLVFSLEALCFHLVKRFPLLPAQYHGFAVSAVLEVFHCPATAETLVENVVYQAVIETCSHPAVAENQVVEPDVLTYRKYIPLWTGILRARHNDKRSKIFESFLKALMSIIDKLDLSVVQDEEESLLPSPEPEGESMEITLTQTEDSTTKREIALAQFNPFLGKKANVVKDFTVLVNLVDVSLHIMKSCEDLVSLWLPELWTRVSVWSYDHHDVSSFYKFAAMLLELTMKTGEPDPGSELSELIQQFLAEHLMKTRNFDQTELRLTAFTLVTKVPLVFVSGLLDLLPEVLEQIFQLGAGVPELANSALSAVQAYVLNFREEALDGVLRAVLPNLGTFLSYQPAGADNVDVKQRRGGPVNIRKKKRKEADSLNTKNYEEDNCRIALSILSMVSESLSITVFI